MNPLFLCYNSTVNVANLAKPSAIFVTGRTNRNALEFQVAREKGAEIYPYFNLIERRIERVSALDMEFYMGDYVSVPLWGSDRRGYQDQTLLLDIRPGSEWIKWAVEYLRVIVSSKKFDGFFFDVIGGRLWMSDWLNWPKQEQQEWQAGAVEAVKLVRQMIQAENPNFIIVNNSHWLQAPEGEKYVNGVCIEGHSPITNPALGAYVKRPFGFPNRRRVLTINKDLALAKQWADWPDGATHVAHTPSGYGEAAAPVVEYTDIRVKEMEVYIKSLKDHILDLNIENAFLTDDLHKAQNAYQSTLEKLRHSQDEVDKATRRISAGISALTV